MFESYLFHNALVISFSANSIHSTIFPYFSAPLRTSTNRFAHFGSGDRMSIRSNSSICRNRNIKFIQLNKFKICIGFSTQCVSILALTRLALYVYFISLHRTRIKVYLEGMHTCNVIKIVLNSKHVQFKSHAMR